MNETEMFEQSSLAVKNQNQLAGNAKQRNQIRAPYVEPVATHVQELRYAAPHYRVAPCSSPTQAVWRSRSRMMALVRIKTTAIAYIQHAIDMISMPVSIVVARAS